MVPGNPGRICSEATVMSRLPSVVTCALALENPGELATTVAVPGAWPRTVALAATAPAGIVMLLDTSPTAAGLLLTSDTSTPPAGAGLEMLTGNEDVAPSGAVSVAGTDNTLFVTDIVSVQSA